MGANASTQIIGTVNSTVSESMASSVSNQAQIVNPESHISQSIEYLVGAGGKVTCTTFSMSNDGKVTVAAQGQFKTEQYADIASAADATYDQAIKDAVEQSNEDFNLGQFNFNELVENVVNESKSISTSSIESSMQQTVSPTTTITQSIKFTIFGEFTSEVCDFSNNAAIDVSTDYAAENLTSQLLSSEAGQELLQELTNSVVQKNEGLSLGVILGIIIGVIVLILIIAIPLGILHAQGKI